MVNAYRLVRSALLAPLLIVMLTSSAWVDGSVYSPKRQIAASPALAVVLHEDFEDDATGALGAPWSISSAGTGTVSIVNTTDHGHVLRLVGSPTEGHFLIASLPISASSQDLTVQVEIKRASGASFIWILNGAGTSIGRRRIRLQVPPGSSTLSSQTVPSGTTDCGKLAAGVWKRVTLNVHTGPRTFDVLIDGAATNCTGIRADIQPPFNSVSVMDASNTGWGGTVRFDNIDISSP